MHRSLPHSAGIAGAASDVFVVVGVCGGVEDCPPQHNQRTNTQEYTSARKDFETQLLDNGMVQKRRAMRLLKDLDEMFTNDIIYLLPVPGMFCEPCFEKYILVRIPSLYLGIL